MIPPIPAEKSFKSSLPFIFSRAMAGISILLLLVTCIIIFSSKKKVIEASVHDLKSWQNADSPFGYPLKQSDLDDIHSPRQKFDSRFHFHSPWERAAIPNTEQFEAPMGSETGAFTYNAQPFNSLNNDRGGNHSGDDINGIGGMNSDLSDPVYAVANGLVVYVGKPSPSWGNCVILAHRTPDGKIIHSMYAHLLLTQVSYMEQIPRGYEIGKVGNADGQYLAHLHLEMRESDGVSPFLSGYPTLTQHDRLNPNEVIKHYMAKESDIYNPSILDIAQITQIRPDLNMDTKSAQEYMKYMRDAPKDKE